VNAKELLHKDLRDTVSAICDRYPEAYWRNLDCRHSYPSEFIGELTAAGCLSSLVPEEYGGLGLGLSDATVVLEEINRRGGNATAVHAQMYTMAPLAAHGSREQKDTYLPRIASGELRLQSFAITEPDSGSDMTGLKMTAERRQGGYVLNGKKVFTSRVNHSDLMLLLARTSPAHEVARKSDGLSLFLVDLRQISGLTIKPIETMLNHDTNELFFDHVEIPAIALVGEEGHGFSYVMDILNAERILVAAECIGDGYWFIDKASKYASQRVVFGRPIGQNQGVQFPLARAYAQLRAADLMRWKAAELFDAGEVCGTEANLAKLLASEASWDAANAALQTHGGYGFASEYAVERKFRENRLYQVAPVSTNLILSYLSQHVLGMPRSF
jgi:acyl-CoA dehydrogenase